jgi:uncharacterized membrane protein YcaP (DUF421 family)
MEWLIGHLAWGSMFNPTHPLIDSVLRGTIVYLGLFAVLRVVKNRRAGGLSVSDLLLVTLTANALQNSLIGKGSSVTEGAASTMTVFFWSFSLDWLAFHFPRLRKFVHSAPRQVIRDGTILKAGLQREMLTEDDLWAQLRLGGINSLNNVKEAYVEENGQLSVIQRC